MSTNACPKPQAQLQAAVTADMQKRFHPELQGSTLDVKAGCDGLTEPIETLTFAHGAGHGFNLRVYRFTRDGDHFAVRGLRYRESGSIKRPFKLTVVEGTVPATALDAVLSRARFALSAELNAVAPPSPPGTSPLRSISMSSHNFHIAVTLRTKRHQRRQRYSGYASSMNQLAFIPLQVVEASLSPWLSSLTELDRAPDAEDRVAFADHFLQSAPHFDQDFNWWVKERYVAMARHVGSRSLILPLLTRLKPEDDRSTKDTTDDALAALAAITGWDGSKRGAAEPTREERMKAYRSACEENHELP